MTDRIEEQVSKIQEHLNRVVENSVDFRTATDEIMDGLVILVTTYKERLKNTPNF